jgi:DNA repair exonuclease SbcCD ATPase subunit
MSINRCLEVIEQRFDQQQDAESLVEELAELESEVAEEDSSESYYQHLTSFLIRADELLSEEELNESLLVAAISNLRGDLEKIKATQVPDDPLEHLFLDMVRYQAGTVPAGTTLTTLSRYETLLLALRDRFERSTDPTDDSEVATMMRTGLDILEAAGKRLRQDLGNGLDHAFEEIKDEFNRGTDILMEFRKKAKFVNQDGEEI